MSAVMQRACYFPTSCREVEENGRRTKNSNVWRISCNSSLCANLAQSWHRQFSATSHRTKKFDVKKQHIRNAFNFSPYWAEVHLVPTWDEVDFIPSWDEVRSAKKHIQKNSCQVGTNYERREMPAGKEMIMAIIRVPKVNNYTVMFNHHLLNPALSLKAKGLMSYMLSRPDDWDFTIDGLARLNKEGTDAIGRILRELEAQGYITRKRVRNKSGQFVDLEYSILERPQDVMTLEMNEAQEKEDSQDRTQEDQLLPASTAPDDPLINAPHPEKPVMDDLDAEDPAADDRGQPNNHIINTYGINTDEKNTAASHPYPSRIHLSICDRTAVSVPTAVPGLQRRLSTKELLAHIREQIEYDILVEQYTREEVDNIVSLMAEVLSAQCDHFKISCKQYPAELVRQRFRTLTYHHIEYVFDCLERSRSKIRNIKQYLLATLFNAPATFDSFYRAEVRHDFDFR